MNRALENIGQRFLRPAEGIRALAMLVSAVLLTTFMHVLLSRWLPWPRGRQLVFPHSLASVFLLVALAHPLWPIWTVAAAAPPAPV